MKRRILSLVLAMVFTLTALPTFFIAPTTHADIEVNYAKLLQYSLYFYDGNMCGPKVNERSAFVWRGNCHLQDANIAVPEHFGGGTIDLSGGYHDAGDHVKFQLPIGYSGVTVGWAFYEFREAFEANGLVPHARRILDHFAEYFRKCVIWNEDGVTPRAFAYQVGDGGQPHDHGYWGPPERQVGNAPGAVRIARFTDLSPQFPGTDQVSIAAALLALNYINFGNEKDLETAVALFDWAWDSHREVALDGPVTQYGSFYKSGQWRDKLILAAEWLYRATDDEKYMEASLIELPNDGSPESYRNHTAWPLAWDTVWPKISVLREDWEAVDRHFGGVRIDGLPRVYHEQAGWGNARYNAAYQMVGLIHDKYTGETRYTDWAEWQMRYILGDNPLQNCYVVGYNERSVRNAHHRAASGYEWLEFMANEPLRNLFVGALVGGEDGGNYADHIQVYVYTEVACDYNAGLVGAAAGFWMMNKSHKPVPVSTIPGLRIVAPPCDEIGLEHIPLKDNCTVCYLCQRAIPRSCDEDEPCQFHTAQCEEHVPKESDCTECSVCPAVNLPQSCSDAEPCLRHKPMAFTMTLRVDQFGPDAWEPNISNTITITDLDTDYIEVTGTAAKYYSLIDFRTSGIPEDVKVTLGTLLLNDTVVTHTLIHPFTNTNQGNMLWHAWNEVGRHLDSGFVETAPGTHSNHLAIPCGSVITSFRLYFTITRDGVTPPEPSPLRIDVIDVDDTEVVRVRNITPNAASTKGLFIVPERLPPMDDPWRIPSFIVEPGKPLYIRCEGDSETMTLNRAQLDFALANAIKLSLVDAAGNNLDAWSRQ